MKRSILFLINPISGSTNKNSVEVGIEKYLDQQQYTYEIAYTERAGHATHIAREAVEKGTDILVVVGGDGSVNEVSGVLAYSQTVLGIIPMGSGNGFATHLHIPIRNIKKAIHTLNTGKTISIDIGKAGNQAFISCAGIGLDAHVARTYRHAGKRGFFSYVRAIIKEALFSFIPTNRKIEIDGKIIRGPVYLFSVFNSKYFGYGVGLDHSTSIADGHLNVVWIKPFPFWKIFWYVFLILIHKTHKIPEATFMSAQQICIQEDKKQIYQLDGDSFVTSNPLSIFVQSKVIQVIVPKHLISY